MKAQEKRLTVEEFWEVYAGQWAELVDGTVVALAPSGYRASSIAGRILAALVAYLDQHPVGDVTASDGGYWLSEGNLKVPGVGYFSNAKMKQINEPGKYLPFAPDLAVEVVSPTDRASDIQDKIRLYLAHGTALVWVVYPEQQQVMVYHPDLSAHTLGIDDTLAAEEMLLGFALPVAKIFAQRSG